MANCTQYGLAGSVWSKGRGREVAEQIESGMVWVNTWLHRDLRVPFGGVKDSGVGREGGMWSLDFLRSGQYLRDGRLKAEIPVAVSEANSCQCMQTLAK